MERKIKIINRQNLYPSAQMKVFEDIEVSDVNLSIVLDHDTDFIFYDVDGRTKILANEKLNLFSAYNNHNL